MDGVGSTPPRFCHGLQLCSEYSTVQLQREANNSSLPQDCLADGMPILGCGQTVHNPENDEEKLIDLLASRIQSSACQKPWSKCVTPNEAAPGQHGPLLHVIPNVYKSCCTAGSCKPEQTSENRPLGGQRWQSVGICLHQYLPSSLKAQDQSPTAMANNLAQQLWQLAWILLQRAGMQTAQGHCH
jgi:hypothetical protein